MATATTKQKNVVLRIIIFIFNKIFAFIAFLFPFKKLSKGLYVETARDWIKQGISIIGLSLIAFVWSGFGNLDWSFKSFKLFNRFNNVTEVNQTIRPNAVWRIPPDTPVRIKNGGFVTLRSSGYGEATIQYVSLGNETITKYGMDPGDVLILKDEGCKQFALIFMQRQDGKDKKTRESWQRYLVRYTASTTPNCTATNK